FAFPIRLTAPKRSDATTNAHGTDLAATPTTSPWFSGFPEIDAYPYFTSTPAVMISVGMRMAHRNPITDCLYFTLISRQESMNSRSRHATSSPTRPGDAFPRVINTDGLTANAPAVV